MGSREWNGLPSEKMYKGEENLIVEAVEVAAEELPETTEVSRGQWGNKVEFVLTCIGYSVGLGNVWRFPYVCFKSGGGAFLIPFTIFLFVAGIPLFYLELGLGQYGGSGPITIWQCAPLFKGLGWCMAFISFIVSLYYNVIISWCFFYLVNCFQKIMPWSNCDNNWNTANCADAFIKTCNGTNRPPEIADPENNMLYCVDGSWKEMPKADVNSPAAEFFKFRMLQQSSGIEESGAISWELALCLLVAWIFVFLCLFKGVHSLGKVAYFTAIFPYFFLTALLLRGLSLPGAGDGISFYLRPDFSRLSDPTVWRDAAGQVFFSFGIGWGGLIAFASYNDFNNNFVRDALIVSVADCFTSIYAGFVIFSIIGYVAHTLGVPVEQAVSQGPGLAFEVYPSVVSQLPFSNAWAVMFFVMLIMLGLDTQFATVEGVITALCDQFPNALRKRKTLTTAIFCLIWFVLGLSMCTQGGIYIFTLFDTYAAGCNLLLSGVVELVIISWVYTTDRFYEDIQAMLGSMPHRVWHYVWKYIAPSSLSIVFILTLIFYEPAAVGEYKYPLWADILGWMMVLGSFAMLPIFVLYQLITDDYAGETISERFSTLCQPSDTWLSIRDSKKGNGTDIRANQIHDDNDSLKVPLPPIVHNITSV